jgi:hypothetical protein
MPKGKRNHNVLGPYKRDGKEYYIYYYYVDGKRKKKESKSRKFLLRDYQKRFGLDDKTFVVKQPKKKDNIKLAPCGKNIIPLPGRCETAYKCSDYLTCCNLAVGWPGWQIQKRGD